MTWDTDNFRVINNLSIDKTVDETETVKLDINELRDFNSNNLTMVLNGDNYSSENYDPKYASSAGCQFIFMNYQSVDKYMDLYVSNFNSSFVPKPIKYRQKSDFSDSISIAQNSAKRKQLKLNQGPSCPEKPKDDVEIVDTDSLDYEKPIMFKNKDNNLGLCAFSDKCPIKYNEENISMWQSLKQGLSLVISDSDKKVIRLNLVV